MWTGTEGRFKGDEHGDEQGGNCDKVVDRHDEHVLCDLRDLYTVHLHDRSQLDSVALSPIIA